MTRRPRLVVVPDPAETISLPIGNEINNEQASRSGEFAEGVAVGIRLAVRILGGDRALAEQLRRLVPTEPCL